MTRREDDPSGSHEVHNRPLTFVDLFAGCGGFSLGLEWAGLRCLAAIDYNDSAIETFRRNHLNVPVALIKDLTKFAPKELDAALGSARVDVIVGGPPCQGFSRARQVGGSNHGERLVYDPRRELYREFLKYVAYYQPKVFVMENVPGMRSAAGGAFFTAVQVDSRELGYRVIPYEVQAWRFGVPQKRIRQLIIGTRRELPLFIPDRYIRETHVDPGDPVSRGKQSAVTLGEAIGDLPEITSGDERFIRTYDVAAREEHVKRYGRRYLYDVLKAHRAKKLLGHTSRPHSDRDLRDFRRLREGETSRAALARGVEMEFPYDREHFKDRYTRQHRDQLCSTIVAHLKKDGLMFIHPTQARSLTPREAARIQSFPDTFEFPQERTRAYSEIGNAVPPLVGKAVGLAVADYLSQPDMADAVTQSLNANLPLSHELAITELEGFIEVMLTKDLKQLSRTEFLKAWWAVGYLHPNLHPDAALDNGKELSPGPRRGVSFVLEPYYVRSGWPVELIPLALEARRRFVAKALAEDEYYCSAAVIAGAAAKDKVR
ncbi:MAG: DNA cytosine methyltransferase [Ideonella sp. WA131b]|nr:DNA cytosine methyltransferase [Ideonella sp. WA131b]